MDIYKNGEKDFIVDDNRYVLTVKNVFIYYVDKSFKRSLLFYKEGNNKDLQMIIRFLFEASNVRSSLI